MGHGVSVSLSAAVEPQYESHYEWSPSTHDPGVAVVRVGLGVSVSLSAAVES